MRVSCMCSTGRKMMIPLILLTSLGSLSSSGCGQRTHGPRRLEPPTSGSQSPREPPSANPDEVELVATVTSIEPNPAPRRLLRWVVTLSVDNVIGGSFPMKTFQIAIHSPSDERVEVGHQYRITARKSNDGYDIGEHPFWPPAYRNSAGPT